MVRSAAAMSGRRCSSCDGTPIGTGGGAVVSALTGMEKSEACLPTRTAIACSYCDRNTSRLVAFDCAVLKCCLRLHKRDLVANTRLILCLRQLQGVLIRLDRICIEVDQGILSADLKKIFCQSNLLRESLIFQIRRAYLGRILIAANLIPYLAPDIGLPGNVERQRVDTGLLPGVDDIAGDGSASIRSSRRIGVFEIG